MPAKLPHYLTISRHGIYYLRITRNGRECRRSLRTRDPLEARAIAYQFGAKISAMTKPISGWTLKIPGGVELSTDGTKEDHERALEALALVINVQPVAPAPQVAAAALPPNTPPHPITLAAGIADWLADRRDGVTHNTMEAWSTYTKRLAVEFGGETMVHTISPGQITDARNKLKNGRSEKTVREYAYCWHLLFEWLIEHDHATRNPVNIPKKATKTVVARKKKDEEWRDAWTAGDLDKIFNPTRLNALQRPEFLWLPWLALYTGARREALIHLRASDFNEYAPGAWSIRFDKRFDKCGMERTIPLHPQLIAAGLLDYIHDVRSLRLKSDDLFPHVLNATHGRSHYFGNHFSTEKKALKCADTADFHAFRTTVISVLALNDCPGRAERQFVGHAVEGEVRDTHERDYIKLARTLEQLAAAVLPRLDFSVICWQPPSWRYKPGSAKAQINRLLKK